MYWHFKCFLWIWFRKSLLQYKTTFMPHYKTAFIHIQCKTATAVGSKTIKIRLYLFQIFFVRISFSESVVIQRNLSRRNSFRSKINPFNSSKVLITRSWFGWNFNLSSWDQFHPKITWEIKLHSNSAGQFSTVICLDLFTCSFNCAL